MGAYSRSGAPQAGDGGSKKRESQAATDILNHVALGWSLFLVNSEARRLIMTVAGLLMPPKVENTRGVTSYCICSPSHISGSSF